MSNNIPKYITVAARKDLTGVAFATRIIGSANKEIGIREFIQKSTVNIVIILHPVCWLVDLPYGLL